jgi:uncharacterized lipoprotein YehR (DUF1307 family)
MKLTKVILVSTILLLLQGCSTNERTFTKCIIINDSSQLEYAINIETIFTANDGIVLHLESNQTFYSTKNDILEGIEHTLEHEYEKFDEVEYLEYELILSSDKLIFHYTLDYEQLEENDVDPSYLFNEHLFDEDNQLILERIIEEYQKSNAECSTIK